MTTYVGFHPLSEESELVVGTVQGYRGWRLSASRRGITDRTFPLSPAYLKAASFDLVWNTEMSAACVTYDDLTFHTHKYVPGGEMISLTRSWGNGALYHDDWGRSYSSDVVCKDDACLNHRAPFAPCSCGIYSWYDPKEVLRDTFSVDIIGVTENSGKIILGSKGMRAEHSRILAVAPHPHVQLVHKLGTLDVLRNTYRVETYNTFNELTNVYPADSDLLRNLGIA